MSKYNNHKDDCAVQEQLKQVSQVQVKWKSAFSMFLLKGILKILQHIYPVVMDLLEVFVDGVVT